MDRAPASSWMPPRVLLNVFLLGSTLRLAGLGMHSLWLDEGATWSWATLPTWRETIFAEANHPPAWWMLTRLWISLFGDSEASLRAPAAILGCVTLYLSWRLGLRLLDPASVPVRGGFARTYDGGRGRRIAAWFAGLVTASAFFVEFAQEARMYSALLAEVLGLSLLYLRWLDRGDRRSLVAYLVLGVVAIHTHYFAVWPMLAHGAHALWLARRTREEEEPVNPWPLIATVAGVGLLFLPWFSHLVASYRSIATGAPYDPFGRILYVVWRMAAGPGVIVGDRDRQMAGEAATIAEEQTMILVVGALWFPVVLYGLWSLRRHAAGGSFVAFSVFVPLALLLAVFPWFPLVHERYLLILAPFVFLVATIGAFHAGSVGRPVLLSLLTALMLAGFLAYFAASPKFVPEGRTRELDGIPLPESYGPDPHDPLRVLHHGHPYGHEPWRLAHRDLVRVLARPGDLVVLAPDYIHLAWDYYDRNRLETLRLPGGPALDAEETLRRYREVLRDRRRVFLVLAHEETKDPDDWFHVLRKALGTLWLEEGTTRVTAIPPILFRRSWGVRVAIFDRSER